MRNGDKVLVQLQEDFGFRQSTFESRENGGLIVVTRSCLMLAVDESVDRLLHGLRKVNSNIEGPRSLGFGL